MEKSFLEDRRRALEESFFNKHNRSLVERMKEKASGEANRESLREASGISNEEVLDELLAQGINEKTVALISLVPLVEVAWADHKMGSEEKEAILAGAQKAGLSLGTAAYELLEGWLSHDPDDKLFDAWKSYVKAFLIGLEPAIRNGLRDEILGNATEVAKSSGGILGLRAICSEEEAVLKEIKKTFE